MWRSRDKTLPTKLQHHFGGNRIVISIKDLVIVTAIVFNPHKRGFTGSNFKLALSLISKVSGQKQ